MVHLGQGKKRFFEIVGGENTDAHRKREFDWRNNWELGHFPIGIGEQKWPSLREVLDELGGWHADNYQ